MIGIINILLTLCGNAINQSMTYFQNNTQKQTAKVDEWGCYYDINGDYRDLKTNQILFPIYHHDKYGAVVELVDKNFRVVKRPTLYARNEEIKQFQKEFNETFPSVDYNNFFTVSWTNKKVKDLKGRIFKDKATGRYVVVRDLNISKDSILSNKWRKISVKVYFDYDATKIVRISDEEMFKLFLLTNKYNTPILDMKKITDLIERVNKKKWEEKFYFNSLSLSTYVGQIEGCGSIDCSFDTYDMTKIYNKIWKGCD